MSEPNRYRTRPVEVTAIRWLGEPNCEEVFAFLDLEHPDVEDHDLIDITSYGHMQTVEVGDWIVRYDDGEHQAFSPEEFTDEFEAADNHAPCNLTWAQSISTADACRTVAIPINHGGQFLGNVQVPLAEAVVLRDMLDGLVSEAQQQVSGHA